MSNHPRSEQQPATRRLHYRISVQAARQVSAVERVARTGRVRDQVNTRGRKSGVHGAVGLSCSDGIHGAS